jgi:hypothetical protein
MATIHYTGRSADLFSSQEFRKKIFFALVLYLNKIAWNTIRLEKGTAYVWSSEVLTLSVRFSIFALSPALTLNLLFYFIL